MIKARHPEVADSILLLMHQDVPPSLMVASRAAGELRGVSGFDPPSWQDLANGARPPYHDLDDQEPGVVHHGWQHEAASRVERDFRERRLMPRLADHERALLRSQNGPFAGLAFCAAPASFSPELIRICFGCFVCVVYVSPCPSLFAHVDVAVFLTLLATIGRRVPELGYWADEGSQWKALPLASAEKVEPESPSTCWCRTRATHADWKLWPTGCHFSVVCNWQWTQL